MKLLFLLLLPAFAHSQTKVFDGNKYTFSQAQHVADSLGDGWHLPTAKQLDSIFTATYDNRRLQSSLTPATVYSSDSTVVCTMRGRTMTPSMIGYDFQGNIMRYSFLLIK